MALPVFHTADMVRSLPADGNRYETVYGELLVTPAPRKWHQVVVGRLYEALATYLRATRSGWVFFSPADISWGPDTLVQPDLFVVPLEDARHLEWNGMRQLLLAVEVLSPSSARGDRFTKRRLYQEQAVPVYWVVDWEGRAVEEWTPELTFARVERDRLVWRPDAEAEAFELRLDELFRPL